MILKSKFHYKQVQILLCTCLLSLSSQAQQQLDTIVDYNQYGEFPCSIYQIQDSGYIFNTSGFDVPNNTYWMEFNKLNTDGSIAFQKLFGWSGYKLFVGSPGSLKPTYDGGWVFGGSVGYITPTNNNGLFVKYNSAGDTEFVKIIGDTSADIFNDCIQTSDSSFVLVGDRAKYSPNINNDYWIVKTDANGDTLWERTLGGNFDEQAKHVIENAQHQIVVSGGRETTFPIHYPYFAIYDLQGNLITTKSFNQGALVCAGGSLLHYGQYEYLLMGCLDTTITAGDHAYPEYVARLDSEFHFRWRTDYNSPEVKDIYIAKEISDGGVILVGYKHDNATFGPIGWIAKMDSSGNKLWEHFYLHTAGWNYFSDFRETFDHGFIVCGSTNNNASGNQDSWIVKLDSNGCLDVNCGINTGTIEVPVSVSQFTAFPNPTTQHLIVTTLQEKGELILYDFLGKQVIPKIIVHEKEITIDVSSLANGIYLLQFNTGKKMYTTKVVKN